MSFEVQWTDRDPATGERRFVNVTKFAGKWLFKVRNKRRENWSKHVSLTKDMWEELLDGLERRVQRTEGVTDADVAEVKKIVRDWRDE